MHPFSSRDKLGFLIGETVTQIRMNPFNLDFLFESGTLINCEYAILFSPKLGSPVRYDIQEQFRSEPVIFHQCIGKRVINLAVSELKLSLIFEDENVLHIESDIGPYESGQIVRASASGEEPTYIVF
jgi:hypothetical protein